VEDEARAPGGGSRCVCAHDAGEHHEQSGNCLAVDPLGAACSCTQFQLMAEVPPLERVKIIRAQLEALREILHEARRRGLVPEEELAFGELAEAFAELNRAWREVFGE
jgi:hypothetical protein